MGLGEDLLDALESSRRRGATEFNIDWETALALSDDDGVRKRRKKNSSGRRGSQSSKVAQEEEGEGIQNVFGIDPGHIIFSGGIADLSGRKKKDKKKKDRPTLMWEVLEEENERWIEENLQIDMDLINQNEIVMETMEPSEDLIIPLLRYQKEWLAWALKQEESTARGGILADEMGMGKTLQAIALVLFKRSISLGIPETHLPSSSSCSSKGLPPIKGTLVICPLVAVMQWVREIDRFTSKGSTKVLVYHGASRAKNHYKFSEYDFVITTYSTIEAEFRKYVMPPKDKCQYCGKLFYAHKLKIHLKYMCGPGAVRTAKQAKQQRKDSKSKQMPDIEVHTRKINGDEGKSNGSGRKEVENDRSIDGSDATGLIPSKGKSILHCVAWERIVLDEVSLTCFHFSYLLTIFYGCKLLFCLEDI